MCYTACASPEIKQCTTADFGVVHETGSGPRWIPSTRATARNRLDDRQEEPHEEGRDLEAESRENDGKEGDEQEGARQESLGQEGPEEEGRQQEGARQEGGVEEGGLQEGRAEKAATKKASAKKAAAKKTAAKKADAKKASTKKASSKKAGGDKKKKKKKKAARPKVELRAGARRPDSGSSPLGTKWECFSCGAKFYDLNKEEAVCPKCDANQADRPRTTAKSSPSDQPIRPTVRPMAPLLEDDDDRRRDDDLDLERPAARTPQSGEEFFDDATKSTEGEED